MTTSMSHLGGRGKKDRESGFEGLPEQSGGGMTLRIAADRTNRGVESSATGNIAGVKEN